MNFALGKQIGGRATQAPWLPIDVARTTLHPRVCRMSVRGPTPNFCEREAELRVALAQRRLIRRSGLAASLVAVLSSGTILFSKHFSDVTTILSAILSTLPDGLFAVGGGLIASSAIAVPRYVKFELGKDGILYIEKRHPRLKPLRYGRASIDVRLTGDGRGRGAFARLDIPANTCIGKYRGELLDNAAFLSRYDSDASGNNLSEYAICVDADFVVDGKQSASGDRFSPSHMNHSSYKGNVNVGKIYSRRKRKVTFYTTRDVHKGEELRFDYGRQYWRGREHLEI